jgi:WXG100 family type VII secretion target
MKLTVKYGSVDTLVTHLTQWSADIEAILEELDSKVAALRGTWAGVAATAYVATQKQWRDSMAAYAVFLAEAGQILDSARQSYSAFEEASEGFFG